MSIRVLCVGRAPGGAPSDEIAGARYLELVEALRRAGLDVRTFGIPPSRYPAVLTGWTGLRRVVARDGPQIVHALWGGAIAMSAALAAANARLVVSFAGTDLQPAGPLAPLGSVRERLRHRLSYFAAGRAHRLTVETSSMLEQLPPGVRARCDVLPSGVDLGRFRRADRAETRRALGWTNGRAYVLLNVSSGTGAPDNPVKNTALARAVIERLLERRLDVELVCLHDAPYEQMPDYLSAADALLVTSRTEGSPRTVKEALACELPVVSVPVGDVPERLHGVGNCHVVDADPERLASALERALEFGPCAPGGRQSMIDDGLDLASYVEKLLRVYDRTLAT